MIIKILIIAFILFVVWRTYLRYTKKDITGRELIIWLIFWSIVGLATLIPKQTDLIAQWVGVERGADLLVYVSIITLFFVAFSLIVKLEKIDRDITKLIRQKALDQASQEKNK